MRRVMMALAMLACVAAGGVAGAQAKTAWQASHPRRAQVNDRLANQIIRIHQERTSGAITGAQARQLHAQDHQIRLEERSMASQHDGHITRPEQAALNRQENVTSYEIGL